MKSISRFTFSVLMTLTFVFSTMLQFHHHDVSGNIYLYVTGIGEVEISSHHHPIGETCHNHSHTHNRHAGCSDSENHSDSECAMHLDETIVNDDYNISKLVKVFDHYLSQVILPEITLIYIQQNILNISKFDCLSHFVIESTGFLETVTRRGPPSIA